MTAVLLCYTRQNTLIYMHTSTHTHKAIKQQCVIKVKLEKVIQTSSPHREDVILGIILSN